MIITLVDENTRGGTPTTSELAAWASYYGLSTPVVADPGGLVYANYSGSYNHPNQSLLRTGAEIVVRDYGTSIPQTVIEAVLPR